MRYILLTFIVLSNLLTQTTLYSQEIDFHKSEIYLADRIYSAKFKNGYTKSNPSVPEKYRMISEEKGFFGGEDYKYIKNIDLNILLSINKKYVYIPTGSYIIFEFKEGIRDIENSIDLMIQSCTSPCSCGKSWQDSALVSVSTNNRLYTPIGYVKSKETNYYDFTNFAIKNPVHFVKIEGISAKAQQYGFELMNILGFKERPVYKDSVINASLISQDTTPFITEEFILQDVLFEFDASALKDEQHYLLDSLLNRIQESNVKAIIISGHTDSKGSEDYNYRLSLARANTIKNLLLKKGIESTLIQAIGFGESKLIENIDSLDYRNRRVVIELKIEK